MRLFYSLLISALFAYSSNILACVPPYPGSDPHLASSFELPSNQWRIISLPTAPPATANTIEAVTNCPLAGY